MSQLLINNYLNELSDLRKVSGTSREAVVREAFKDLLKGYASQRALKFVPEYEIESPAKERRYVDGALLHELRVPFGYWEAKDEDDNLDEEIAKKFKRGYPKDNIIFEDSREAVLIQNGVEVMRCDTRDAHRLERLLDLYFGYERAEIAEFNKAVEQFKKDLPAVLAALRERIEDAQKTNAEFRAALQKFLKHAQETINPSVNVDDVKEMLIQHILTEEIFAKVFNDAQFHHENNVAKELYALEEKFFVGGLKKQTLAGLNPYYAAIRSAAAQISSHAEKQKFLKVIYENFYKVYNKKAADRLGVVYTPNEIVKFMIEGADWLCQKHFGKSLIDRDVEILDPATGTGTFVTELLEHFRGQREKLKYKYRNELHANEVAILPYYVANLNIEATYAALTQEYEEFPNLCFVDTLDNVAGLGIRSGYQHDLFGALSEENVERIKRQNRRKISVIIGNPPYNANQQNENDNNKNRTYPRIDDRIKATYIKESTAQKTKLYDMYARFFRWASDRLHEDGLVAFITNRGFIDKRNFDGFRKTVFKEFEEIWVIDLGGDWKESGVASGGNVFGIGTGVAISFFIRKRKPRELQARRIRYAASPVSGAEEKLSWISQSALGSIAFDEISPNKTGDWTAQSTAAEFRGVDLISKKVKQTRIASQERALLKTFSLGVVTARDDWVYDDNERHLVNKMQYLISTYGRQRLKDGGQTMTPERIKSLDYSIKWTRALKKDLASNNEIAFERRSICRSTYRPFVNRLLYFDSKLNEMRYQLPQLFSASGRLKNPTITFTDAGSQKPFMAMAVDQVFDYHLVGSAAAAVGASIRRTGPDGNWLDNITDWGHKQFQVQYEKGENKPKRLITKDAIFYYVYGVLHDPVYREKYALNLKREFPRIPFYPGFWQWADWGKRLMNLHIGYEAVKPWALERRDARSGDAAPKPMLRADKANGTIILDSSTTLSGIPPAAWDYRLGNRSALEWILDQYKEKKPKDPTIAAKFNTYRFADYKEKVIDLLKRVTRVSVETMAIVDAMKKARR